MGKMDGKVVVITGTAAGLGKQISLRFANEGASKLAMCDINESKMMETKKLCEKAGAEVLAVRTNLEEYNDIKVFCDKIGQRFGTIDVLVNNAHHIIMPPVMFLDTPVEHLDIHLRSSLYATWHMMQLCFPYMKDKGGSIINYGSYAGISGQETWAPYAAAKEGIRGLSRVVAREWGQYNIRVNCITPGAWTDTVQEQVGGLPQEIQDWVNTKMRENPFNRPGVPYDDVAPVVVFLASDESRWLTGQTLHVEGGLWIAP